jgi:hypothetical protein
VPTSAAAFRCQARGLAAFGKRSYLPGMILDLTDKETDALARLLSRTIDDGRYSLSPRVQTLKAILAKIQREPARNPLPTRRRMRHRVAHPVLAVSGMGCGFCGSSRSRMAFNAWI